jgi:hypothetical protein
MILIFEMFWPGTGHAVTNSAAIQTIARAFPEQAVRVFAETSHLHELQSDGVLRNQTNVSMRTIPISSHYVFRPQIVSVRRGLRELWTLLSALRGVAANEPCLIVLLSTTPTAILIGSTLSRLMRRRIRMQVCLHGNLNDAFGWRSRNPVVRAIDLHAALRSRHGGTVRFIVLENAVREALIRQVPTATDTTDVLPLPINQAEADMARPKLLTAPVRFGLVGQATEAKGITSFLELARHFRRILPDAVTFHLVGHPAPGADVGPFAVLHDPLPATWPTRAEFIERLATLHYVCLPLHPTYYELAASGALLDAITWLKPIIATPVPIIADLFANFGDIGFLCDDLDQMRAAIDSLAHKPDQKRYDRQVANLQRIRASRLPAALAASYRTMIEMGFPGLLTDNQLEPARDLVSG